MREGERERVKVHLRILWRQGEGEAEQTRVDALIARVPRSYWKKHCSYTIEAPQQLARDLLNVYIFFKDLIDPETGRPFFTNGHAERCRHELTYVAAGYLSDCPHIQLYVPLRELKTKLVIRRCLRSSSALEGYHQHLDDAAASCGHRSGLRYFNAVTNAFDWRWVVRALTKASVLPSWVRHYNFALIDLVYDCAEKLYGSGGGQHVLPGWQRTKLMHTPFVRHGVHYGLSVQRCDAEGSVRCDALASSEVSQVCALLKYPHPLKQSATSIH